MKALVYTGKESLEVLDYAQPEPRDGEVLIRVDSVGICGSDMHAYLGHDERRPAPLILGHEAAGVVVGGASDGRRVTVNPLVTCGGCRACQAGQDNLCPDRQIISMPPREGAFAQWLTMPEGNLVTVPDHVRFEQAALAEPIACGWHAVRLGRRALGLTDRSTAGTSGQDGAVRALVLGGGAIGLGAALSCQAQGIADVTLVEPNDLRRAFLQQSCGQKAVTPDELGASGGYDLVIDGVGYAATRAQASAQVRPGGVIMHIGLGSGEGGLDIRRMTLQEITFIGTYTYTAEDFRQTAAAIFDGRLGALDWIETRALDAGAGAFADIRAGQVASPKVILKPWG
jgi:L-iditol 2-dehydrogenase